MECGLCDRQASGPDEPVEDWQHEFHGFWVWVCPECQDRREARETDRAQTLRELGLTELRSSQSGAVSEV